MERRSNLAVSYTLLFTQYQTKNQPFLGAFLKDESAHPNDQLQVLEAYPNSIRSRRSKRSAEHSHLVDDTRYLEKTRNASIRCEHIYRASESGSHGRAYQTYRTNRFPPDRS
jgi:hypothetical protein